MVLIRRRTMAAIGAALAVALAASPATADELTRRDPKDTVGPLDIRRLTHGHKGEEEFVHLITMHRRFQSRSLRPGRGRVRVLLYEKKHLDDGTLVQIIAEVKLVWRDGRLRAPIFDELSGPFRKRLGVARTTRPDRRTVRVVIPREVLGDLKNPPVYLWAVAASFRDRGKCSRLCWDLAPDRTLVAHKVKEEGG